MPVLNNKDKYVCFVSQRDYPSDQRLYTEILALQELGYTVHLLCTRDNRTAYSIEEGVHVYRIPSLQRKRGSKIRYLLEYTSFLISAFFILTFLHIKYRYRLVHVTNLPDLLILSALVPRLTGAKLVFDVRECSPEMFNDRLGVEFDSSFMKFIILIEQWAIKFAHSVVTCTEQMKQAMVRRGADPNKIFVMLNISLAHHPKAVLPDANDKTSLEHFCIVTHGTIIKRYGLHILIDAMPLVLNKLPKAHLYIIGKGEMRPELEGMVERLKLNNHISFVGFVPDDMLVNELYKGHCGVVTLERNPEADLVHTHKMFEYIALGIPVVISRTTAVEAYFKDTELCFFEAGNAQDLARALLQMAQNPQLRYQLAVNALRAYAHYSPEKQKLAYQVGVKAYL